MIRFMMKKLGIIALVTIISGCGLNTPATDDYSVNSTSAVQGNDQTATITDKGGYYLLSDDILLDKEDPKHQDIIAAFNHPEKASGTIGLNGFRDLNAAKWPNGKVPYYFSGTFSDSDKETIREAMRMIEMIAKVEYYETTAADYRYKITRSTDPNIGGASTLGYSKNATYWYNTAGVYTVAHELYHGLGFAHEHQRPDRDSFVKIISTNIDPKYASNFDKYPANISATFGAYDYDSMMHYPARAFAISAGRITIDSFGNAIGQRSHISSLDNNAADSVYGNNRTSYCALWKPSTANEIQITGYKRADFITKYNQLIAQGYRLSDLQGYTWNSIEYFNAIFKPSTAAETWVIGWARADFVKKCSELNAAGWRLKILQPYNLDGNERINAVWEKSSVNEYWVLGWARADFITKYYEMKNAGWRLKSLKANVVNNVESISAVWQPGSQNETWVIGWNRTDFVSRISSLYNSGWRIASFQPYMLNGTELYCAVWNPGNTGEYWVLGYAYEDYQSVYTQVKANGWRLSTLSAFPY